MGLNASSRKLTVTNQDSKLIDVSAALVERITQGGPGEARAAPRTTEPPQVHSRTYTPPPPEQMKSAPVKAHQVAPVPVQEYTLSALQVQQQKEQELQDQETYWQMRLQKMEEHHAEINKIFDDEHQKAMDELVQKKEVSDGTDPLQGQLTPCLENCDLVIKCYQDNPKEILKCADLVEQFSNCVDQQRAQVIAAR